MVRLPYLISPTDFNKMMTSSNGNFSPLLAFCGEFTGDRWIPSTKTSDAEFWRFFDLRLDKRLSKQSWDWWFETPSFSLWRHYNESRSTQLGSNDLGRAAIAKRDTVHLFTQKTRSYSHRDSRYKSKRLSDRLCNLEISVPVRRHLFSE